MINLHPFQIAVYLTLFVIGFNRVFKTASPVSCFPVSPVFMLALISRVF